MPGPYRFDTRVEHRQRRRRERRLARASVSRKQRVELISRSYGGRLSEDRSADMWSHYVSDKWFGDEVPF